MMGLIIILAIIISFVLAIRSIEKEIDDMERHIRNFNKESEKKVEIKN